jgi:hypothetical protein
MNDQADSAVPANAGAVQEPLVPASLSPELLAAYKRMLTYQFTGTVLLVLVLAFGLLTSYVLAKWQPPILVLIALAGMLGAFFSALTRLYNVDQMSVALISPTVSKLSGWHLLMYSFVPPVVGTIASVVLYVGFISGLVAGGLFPEMACKNEAQSCSQLVQVLNEYGPADAKDYGRALIWSFIAGFSERLVPDALQSLVAKAQKEENA